MLIFKSESAFRIKRLSSPDTMTISMAIDVPIAR